MAAPSGTIWGSISSDKGKLGLYITSSSTNTTVTLTVQVWLALKYDISDTNNNYYFSYTNDSGTTTTNPNGTSLNLSFGTKSGAGWADVSQKLLGTYTLSYTRGTSAKTVSISSSLKNLAGSNYSVSVATTKSIPAKPSYTVAYNANGGSGAPSSQTKWYGTNITLSTTKPSRTGYTFQGWATSSTGGVAYAAGATYSANANVTLYAVWKAITYTVTFNANGGTGAPGNQTKTYGVTLTLSTTKPTRSGYNFAGWGTSATATTAAYNAGGSYTSNANITLYAIWTVAYIKPFIESIKVYRCDSSGAASDEGTFIRVTFDWSTFNNVTSITAGYKLMSDSSYTDVDIDASGTNGTVDVHLFTLNGFSVEKSYDIRITVTDSGGSTYADRSISSMFIPVDFLAGGKGLGIGKVAETEGLLDVGFNANFRGAVYGKVRGLDELPAIPDNSDFNTYTSTGVWSVRGNANATTMSNMPQNVAGILEVFMSTGHPSNYTGWLYVRQKFTPYTLNHPTYERDLVWNTEEWVYGKWIVTSSNGSNKILWSGTWYMNASQTATLSEAISAQPNGAVFVWSFYNGSSASYADMSYYFVPKHHAVNHAGSGIHMESLSPWSHMAKYLYVRDTTVQGNEYNVGTRTYGGVTFNNSDYVLVRIIGV